MEFVWLMTGVVAGGILGWLIASLRANRRLAESTASLAAAEQTGTLLREQLQAQSLQNTALQSDLEARGQELVRHQTHAECEPGIANSFPERDYHGRRGPGGQHDRGDGGVSLPAEGGRCFSALGLRRAGGCSPPAQSLLLKRINKTKPNVIPHEHSQ